MGTGKTTICRHLINGLPEHFHLAYILNTRLDSADLLASICKELGVMVDGADGVKACVDALYEHLLATHGAKRQTLVIIEEAQNLDANVLETLRLLTNLETDSAKLLHIVLIGQPELLDTLNRPALRQLNQRVVASCHLGPLSRRELRDYVHHRLAVAGARQAIFSAGAIRALYARSGGIPRLVNLIAERSLVGAYGYGRVRVGAGTVNRAAREILARPTGARRRRIATIGGAAMCLIPLAVVAVISLSPGPVLNPAQLASAFIHGSAETTGAPDKQDAPLPSDHGMVPAADPIDGGDGEEKPQGLTVFEQWLAHWGIDSRAKSLPEICERATDYGLACEVLDHDSIADLLRYNLPVLVTLANGRQGLDYVLVHGVEGESLALYGPGGDFTLPREMFARRWQGGATLLWRPPPEYRAPLHPGQHAPALVATLEEDLTRLGYLTEPLVTGGVYSDYLAHLVKRFQGDRGLQVDGIVGVQTLTRLAVDTSRQPGLADRGG